MRRFLVTGAAGFIGSHVTDCLLQQGCEVVGVDDLSTGRAENLSGATRNENFRFHFGDVSGEGVMEDFCDRYRPDGIIHLAGLVSVIRADREPDLNFRLNLLATQRVAEAARKSGVSRIVFSSSAAVYGDATVLPIDERAPVAPINLYGSAKALSEQLLAGHAATFGMTTISLRFFNVYGPRQDPASPYSGVMSIFADRFSQGRPVTVFGDGKQTRDFVSVFDVARAVSAAARKKEATSGAYNVATGRAVNLLEVIDAFREFYPEAGSPIFEPSRSGEILHSLANPEAAANAFGFRARVGLFDGIRSLITGKLPGGEVPTISPEARSSETPPVASRMV